MLHAARRLLLLVAHEIHGGVSRSEEPPSNVRHPLGQSRGEKQRLQLVVVLGSVENGLDVFNETHIEHLIRLVEDAESKLLEAQGLALQVVLHATGGADDDVTPGAECALLVAVGRTAIHADCVEFERGSDVHEIGVYLLGELASGSEEGNEGATALDAPATGRKGGSRG